MRNITTILIVPCLALLTLMASCGGSGTDTAPAPKEESSSPPDYDLGADDRTDKPVQAKALVGSGYSLEPLLTVGDEIPLLVGDYPGGSGHPRKTFALPGIPDGLGIFKHGKNYFVWCNHEMGAGSLSRYSDTIDGQIDGARVSLLKLDKHLGVIAGRNLIERIYDRTGLIGTVNLKHGMSEVVQTGTVLNRLCSATLSDIYGHKPLFFAGEEATNGRALVIDTGGDARVIDDLVKVAYENIVPISKWSHKTVLVGLEDTSSQAYLILYVGGDEGCGGGNDGFESGTSYVAKVFVGGVAQTNTSGLALGATNELQWIEVPRTYDFDGAGGNPPDDLYASTAPYYNWAKNVAKATEFKRPEDGSEDPEAAGTLDFVTTGRSGTYDPYGRVWRLVLGSQPTASGTLKLTSIGGPAYYMNPDNVTTDEFGQFWLQEDPSGTQGLMLAAGRRASIYRSPVATDGFVRLFEVNQDDAPFNGMGIPGFAADPWETSGIVEVPGKSAFGKAALLFDTQAHGWSDADYVEGGQLILAFPSGA